MSVDVILLSVFSVLLTIRTTTIHMWLSIEGQSHLVSWLSKMTI
jgi:hypothetical protein